MSTRRSSLFPGTSKKISSWVRPGVWEVRASALRPVSALIRLDLPTLERPAKAISIPAGGGSDSTEAAAQMNCQSPAKMRRPCSINSAAASRAMSTSLSSSLLLAREQRFQVVEQFDLGAVALHDEALLQHAERIVPGPVDHQARRER